ncbi:MAG TPA: VWA domain-containing protein, partial [Thermomicrobiales bacterium]|nr:VWA domain-containing protein [Thermomicrobiales bacterium]
ANINLPRGDYLLRVSGDPDPAAEYILRIDVTTPPSASFESEPNDSEELAATLDPNTPMSGRFDGDEWDVYRFTTSGDPQLWEVAVAGTGIGQLDFTKRDGTELSTGEINADRTSARLSDLYLTPGDHWLRVSGENGDYTITLTALGPPVPGGEHESNNLAVTAEPMLVGETKTGRLVQNTDVDVFRFSLAANEHIVLALDAPDDGTVDLRLDWGNAHVASMASAKPGDRTRLDLMLLPGDYVVTLSPAQVSTGRYSFQVSREDPFAVSDDQEPNDTIATAQRLPAGKEMRGELTGTDGHDIYLIAPGNGRKHTFALKGDGVYPASLSDDAGNSYSLTPSVDGATYTVDQRIPDDVPLYLDLTGAGTYRLTYGASSGGGGLQLPSILGGGDKAPLDASLVFETTEVAAYLTEAQAVDGTLTLTNTTQKQVDFVLLPATSHYHFSVDIDDAPNSIGAGQTVDVPIHVAIEPDAWADIPVRITIGIEVGDVMTSAFTEITPTAAAAPANPTQAWPIPFDVLGGFDLASPALGATVAGTVDPAGESLLHDGVAPVGSGLVVNSPVLPLTLTVDLAGDAAAPVRGIILNPLAGDGMPQSRVRQLELQLSTDGVTYTTVWTGELSAIGREQAFLLPEPIEATHAQLVILSSYDTNPTAPSYLGLGEWSVIAEPGFVPETVDRINVADPAFGGHIVRTDPQLQTPDEWQAMLDGDRTALREYPSETGAFSWVIGFQDDRAALVTDLAWIDPDGTNPDERISKVTVEVTTGTPSGPWESLGTWTLKRNDKGGVRRFKLDAPAWARFIRISGAVDPNASSVEYPAQIQIFEAQAGDGYRSVIGAWGGTSAAAMYELKNPPPTQLVQDETDAPDQQDQAAPLALGEMVNGQAQGSVDVDWYRVTAPKDDNTLTFTLTGVPTVDVTVRVSDSAGAEVPVTRAIGQDTSTIVYSATVTPGAEYTVKVAQPPHSIIFAFDTSMSMGPYEPMVQASLRSFAAGIEKGQEFVQVMPFEEEPLLESWADDSYLVYSAINGYYDKSLSSSSEATILDATNLLADQEGSTAILLVTDAETSSFDKGAEMWQHLDVVQPRIFAVHVAGSSTPVLNEHLMQDWSSNGGYYQYTVNQAEMDRAFDRAATWLRRPAGYSLVVSSTSEEPATPEPAATETPAPEPTPAQPGTLSVVAPPPGETGSTGAAQVSDQVTIEIILDTSGSMLAAMPDGQRRIDVARNVLTDLVTTELPAGVPITLRTFGNQPDSCDTNQVIPVQPLDPATVAATIQGIEPVNLVRTPIGASLEQVANDLAGVDGPKIVVLVTDGEETCGGDPAAAIQSLIDQGIDVQVNIVGFALDDDALRAQFRDWARIGNGSYFDATNAEELDQAIAKAVLAPFRVLDADGNVVASGTVGGDPVELPAGTYTVV